MYGGQLETVDCSKLWSKKLLEIIGILLAIIR